MSTGAIPASLTIKSTRSGDKLTFTRDKDGLVVERGAKRLTIPYRQVLDATNGADNRTLQVTYLGRKKAKGPFTLYSYSGEVQDGESSVMQEWVKLLIRESYDNTGVSQKRRLKILVNPHGGTKKGASIYKKTVEPILKAAKCVLDTTFTTHGGHAFDIAKNLPLDTYDAIISVSGDGLIHEVMNGFANHESPRKALQTPIAPIPTGSGNGLSLNLLGIDYGFDVTEATLNAIKGRPMSIDLFSVTQGGKRSISFMSQAMGLMADLDIGTEHLRWMGDTRFMVGLLRGIIQWKPCPVKLSYKLAENDKMKMTIALESSKQATFPPSLVLQQETSDALPEPKYGKDDADGWIDVEEPILYVYAGKGPYVGRDYMAFPVSLPDDGLVDIMIMPLSSRKQMLSAIAGAATGDSFWIPELHYVKAHAYRIKPLAPKGSLAIDGEAYPFEEFQVEVHPKMATLLSPHGFYAAEFPSPRSPMSPGLKSSRGAEFPGLAQAQAATTAV